MKYRIKKEGSGYRAEIQKTPVRGNAYWLPIEQDNLYNVGSKTIYNTIEEAEEACRKHHIDNKYESASDVVKEFEL